MTLLWLLVWDIVGAPTFHASGGWGITLIVAVLLEALGRTS